MLASIYLAVRIYRSMIAPLRLLSQGAAALEDKDFSVKLLPTGSREMDSVVTVYNHMIDQLRAERVGSKQREEFLDRLLESAELGVVILDFEGEIASMNAWAAKKSSDDEFMATVVQPALREGAAPQQVKHKGGPRTFVGPGSRRYHVERAEFMDRGFERGFLIIQDVTAELLTAEKEAYGKVIRMMAHEVNNTNAAVVSVLRTLLEAAVEDDPDLADLSREYLPAVVVRADNMTAFIRNFARVVRLPPPNPQPVLLTDLLRRSGEVMSATLGKQQITLEYDLLEGTESILVDVTQIEQVVINALTNSLQSIGTEGTIRIRTSDHGQTFTIADNGPGISKEASGELFKPFFSTKPNGQGVGLTLAREILEAHGAAYRLRTDSDGWTRFIVTFPKRAL